jgi:hypothetical protein
MNAIPLDVVKIGRRIRRRMVRYVPFACRPMTATALVTGTFIPAARTAHLESWQAVRDGNHPRQGRR